MLARGTGIGYKILCGYPPPPPLPFPVPEVKNPLSFYILLLIKKRYPFHIPLIEIISLLYIPQYNTAIHFYG